MPQKALQLYKVYLERMMRQPYSWRIIPTYVNLVQGYIEGNTQWSTIFLSYLSATAFLSYLINGGHHRFILIIVFLGLAIHSDRDVNETLEKYTNDSDNGGGRQSDNQYEEYVDLKYADPEELEQLRREDISYPYGRQSQEQETDEDKESSSSVDTQIANAKKNANEHDRKVLRVFRDENESGFTFEREEFQKLLRQIERVPGTVELDRINRLGRNPLETIYVVGKLHYEYEVPISTYRHGDFNFDNMTDQIMLVVNAIAAGKSVKERVRSAWETIWNRFLEERRWYTWFDKVPIGYKIEDEGYWIEPHQHGPEVVKAILTDLSTYTRSEDIQGGYEPTKELVQRVAFNEPLENNSKSAEFELTKINRDKIQSVFEASDYPLSELKWSHIKKIANWSVYVGELRVPRSADPDDQHVFEDETLSLVDEQFFYDIQKNVVGELSTKYSKGAEEDEDIIDSTTLADLGLVLVAEEESEIFGPICPGCDRGMPKKRKEPLFDGSTGHYYICPKYEEDNSKDHDGQKKFPKKDVWETLKSELENETKESNNVVVFRMC